VHADGHLIVTMEFGVHNGQDRNLGRFRLFGSSSEKAMIAEQIRSGVITGYLKLAAARILSGDIEGAKALMAKSPESKTPTNQPLNAWIHEQLGDTAKATTARERLIAALRKRTDDAPLPMPLIALDVLSKAEDEPVVHLWRGRVLDHMSRINDAAASYGKAIASKPDDAALVLARAQLYLRTHQWKLAAADFRTACDMQPLDHFLWFSCAPLFVWAGDEDGYRKHRTEFLRRFGKSNDAQTAERTAKVCGLLPLTDDEKTVLIELAKRATAAGADAGIAQWAHLARALVSHCVGDFSSAVEHAQSARERDASNASLTTYVQVCSRLVEAIAQQKLGRKEEAERLLTEAELMIPTDLPDIEHSNPDGQFHDLVICKHLQKEAQVLIKREDIPRERGPMPRELGR
jgi:tetratricopeptide (TPR) repeat protein